LVAITKRSGFLLFQVVFLADEQARFSHRTRELRKVPQAAKGWGCGSKNWERALACWDALEPQSRGERPLVDLSSLIDGGCRTDADSHRDAFAESVRRLEHWSKSQLVLRTPIQASYGTRWRDFSVNPTQTTSWRFAGAQGLRVLAPTDNNTRKPRLPTSRLTGSVQPRRAERLELTFSMASISMSEFGPMNLNRSAMSNPSGWW
jgi:hypothetical protein